MRRRRTNLRGLKTRKKGRRRHPKSQVVANGNTNVYDHRRRLQKMKASELITIALEAATAVKRPRY